MRLPRFALALAALPAVAIALPAAAQTTPPAGSPGAPLPACSASVTDHCVQRGGHMAMAGGKHHAMKHHGKHHAKHHAKRHHGKKAATK